MPTIPVPTYGTQAQNAAQGQVNVFDPNTGAPLAGAGAFNPNTGKAITSANLAPNTPYVLPDATNPTPPAAGNLATTSADYYKNLMNNTSKDLVANDKTALSALMQNFAEQGSASTKIDHTAENIARDASNQLISGIEARQKTVKGIQGSGLSKGETDAQIQQETMRIGDLGIQLNAANRNFEGAKAIADQQLKDIIAPLEAQQKGLELFYQDNKDKLGKQEEKALYEWKARLDSQIQLSTYKQKADYDAKIAGYDPTAAPTAPTSFTTNAVYSTLEQVAKQAGLTLDELKSVNPNVSEFQSLKPGTILNLPTKNITNNQEAIKVILGSANFTKDNKANLISAINSGQDPFTVVKNQAKNIMGQTEATKIAGYETASRVMNDLSNNLDLYYASGGDTSLFNGTFENLEAKIGRVSDPELRSLAVQIQSSLASYRNAVSGTAYSVQEGRDIASIFPGINKSEGLNDAIIDGRKKSFSSTIDAAYRNVLGDVYDNFNSGLPSFNDPLGLGIGSLSSNSNNPLGI